MLSMLRGRALSPTTSRLHLSSVPSVLQEQRCFLGAEGAERRFFSAPRSAAGGDSPAAASGDSRVDDSVRSAHGFARFRAALEARGDAIVTCANIFQLAGFACSDVLHLQSLMIIGNGSMALFFLTRMPPMGVPFGWAMLKVFVNIFMVCKIMSDRQPIKLTSEELDAYEEHFMPFGITARQFKKFWDLGDCRCFSEQHTLAREGQHLEAVSLVVSGYVFRMRDGKHVRGLDSYAGARGSRQGDAGAWVGEMKLLQVMDSVSQQSSIPPSASVSQEDGARVQNLQDALVGLDVGDGILDAPAEEKSLRSLRKFQHISQLKEDGIEGPKTQRARKQVDKFVLICSDPVQAPWTCIASKGTVIRTWSLEQLLRLCKSDPELRGMLRKTFAQSAVKKALAMGDADESWRT